MKGQVPNVIAAVLALGAFGVALIAGLFGGNPADVILWRAIISMIACYFIGSLIGLLCQYVVDLGVREYVEAHPIPTGEVAPAEVTVAEPVESDEVIVV